MAIFFGLIISAVLNAMAAFCIAVVRAAVWGAMLAMSAIYVLFVLMFIKPRDSQHG